MSDKKKTKSKTTVNTISKLLISITSVVTAISALLKVIFDFVIQLLELGQ